jgi:hypothetical protein
MSPAALRRPVPFGCRRADCGGRARPAARDGWPRPPCRRPSGRTVSTPSARPSNHVSLPIADDRARDRATPV